MNLVHAGMAILGARDPDPDYVRNIRRMFGNRARIYHGEDG